MTFSPTIAGQMSKDNPVPVLADVLGEAAKEKVTRIVLATFRVSAALLPCRNPYWRPWS